MRSDRRIGSGSMHCESRVHAVARSLFVRADHLDRIVITQERNSLGAVKAVTAAQLAMASDNIYRVSLDQAIEAMRLTAADMSVKYKETSLSVCPSPHSLHVIPSVAAHPPSRPAQPSMLMDNSLLSLLGFGGKSHSSVRRLILPQLCCFCL